MRSSEEARIVEVASGRMLTISQLTEGTVYTVEVAAKNSAGIGVYSHPLIVETPEKESKLLLEFPSFM